MRPFPFPPQHGYPPRLGRDAPVSEPAFRPYAPPRRKPKREFRVSASLWTRLAMLAVSAALLVVLGYALLNLMFYVTAAIQRALPPI
jgi:hypothetical protein